MVSWAGELPPLTLSGRRVGGLRVWGGRFLLRLQIEVFLEPARKVEGLRRRGGGTCLVEVGGLYGFQLKQLVGKLCEAHHGDGTCAAWKTVLGSGEGLGRALGFGALGRVGQ